MRTLNENQVEALLVAAHEVDEVERLLAPGRAGWSGRARWFAAGGAALLAASVAIVAGAMLSGARGVPGGPGTQSAGPVPTHATPAIATAVVDSNTGVEVGAEGLEPNAKVLLAIVGHPDGSLRCVNWSAGVFQGRALSEIHDDELKSIAMSMLCFNPAERMLVVGVEGPRSRLPMTDDRAQELARCMLASPGCESGAFNAGTCATSACLTAGVSVRVKSVAMTP